jgi:hypothetical protein
MAVQCLTDELTAAGHRVGPDTVAKLLKENGFSLQANAKTPRGQPALGPRRTVLLPQRPGRRAPDAGQPVISMDTKKKELVGSNRNSGAEWRPARDPEPVKVHDFIDREPGKANPYGVCDLAENTGWVAVGTDHDTAAFAVNTIGSW